MQKQTFEACRTGIWRGKWRQSYPSDNYYTSIIVPVETILSFYKSFLLKSSLSEDGLGNNERRSHF